MVTTSDPAPGDVVPGGAINPVPTPVYAAEGSGNVSALTFDDGPNPGTTPALLDFLAEHETKAVFCVIGQNIQADGGAAILRRIVADGHVLCNHSTSYADMGSWTEEQVRADLIANMGIIRDALGNPNQKIPFWRAPNGSWGVTPGVAVETGHAAARRAEHDRGLGDAGRRHPDRQPAHRDGARRAGPGARRGRRPVRHPRRRADRRHRAPGRRLGAHVPAGHAPGVGPGDRGPDRDQGDRRLPRGRRHRQPRDVGRGRRAPEPPLRPDHAREPHEARGLVRRGPHVPPSPRGDGAHGLRPGRTTCGSTATCWCGTARPPTGSSRTTPASRSRPPRRARRSSASACAPTSSASRRT